MIMKMRYFHGAEPPNRLSQISGFRLSDARNM